MLINREYKTFRQFLRDQGYYGSVNYAAFQYLGDEGYTGALNKRWYNFLSDLGYTGTLQKMASDWIKDNFAVDNSSEAILDSLGATITDSSVNDITDSGS